MSIALDAPPLKFIDLGRRDFLSVWKMQKSVAQQRSEGTTPDTILFVEHPPVYTRGTSSRKEERPNLPHPLHDVERGGETTFHGPGQLTGYPIFHLKERNLLVGHYLRRLEKALIRAVGEMGLHGVAVPGATGVWVGRHKIASIGVSVRGWVSYHGFSLNVCGDLSPFAAIRPCGFSSEVMASVSDLLARPVSVAEMRPIVLRALEEEFAL
jgi:lipoyl(octanoyl) transferase